MTNTTAITQQDTKRLYSYIAPMARRCFNEAEYIAAADEICLEYAMSANWEYTYDDIVSAYKYDDWKQLNELRTPPDLRYKRFDDYISVINNKWGDCERLWQRESLEIILLLPYIFERLAYGLKHDVTIVDIKEEYDKISSGYDNASEAQLPYEPDPPLLYLIPQDLKVIYNKREIRPRQPYTLTDDEIRQANEDFNRCYETMNPIERYLFPGTQEGKVRCRCWDEIFCSIAALSTKNMVPEQYMPFGIRYDYKRILENYYKGEEISYVINLDEFASAARQSV